MERM
jgi:hypothetical protein